MTWDKCAYPPNWKTEIRPRILTRANHCCEKCGVENHAIGARDKDGVWHNESDIGSMNSDAGFDAFGEYPKIIMIVLTIAHLDNPDPMACEDSNLAALCQRCHNRLDSPMRVKNATKTRLKKKHAAIQQQQKPLWEEG